MAHRVVHCFLLSGLLSAAGAMAEPPLGEEFSDATYLVDAAIPGRDLVVERVNLLRHMQVEWDGKAAQWLRLIATKSNGDNFTVWLLCRRYPSESYAAAREDVLRYMFAVGDGPLVAYEHAVSRGAVLPSTGVWPYLLPESGGKEEDTGSPPSSIGYLGKTYTLERNARLKPGPVPRPDRVLSLRPDVLMGKPHNTREVDETRRYDDSEYEYVPLVEADLQKMVDAGINCFRATPELMPWFEDAGVFYWGGGGADIVYPEALYSPLYLGPDLFLDEPMVVTRDSIIRPRLREDPAFRRAITPQITLDAFKEHFARVINKGAPTHLVAGLRARNDIDLGNMDFIQANLYSWETMVSSAAHQLLYNPHAPSAIVFEPPGRIGTRRTLPAINMSYGCQIPINGDNFIDIIIGFLRGAARASGKEWGISIYGGVDRTEAPAFLTRAYELGATRFFYWDSARLATVPFGEVLNLSRHVSVAARNYPERDIEALRNAAEVAILFPPGYNLGHVHMGKGLLWGVDELHLERRNAAGVPYRTVMHNLFTEIERCIRLGVAFDLLWDLPEVNPAGYREIVRVRDNGTVSVTADHKTVVLDGPRTPPRPAGMAPQLDVTMSVSSEQPRTVELVAHVMEGDAPIYYSPVPNLEGVHRNARVCWELYGPGEEDYAHRRPTITPGGITRHPAGGYLVEAIVQLDRPGSYRLRAATTDLAGRSAVVWQAFNVK